MPWKNPSCPNCHAKKGITQIKFWKHEMYSTDYRMEYGRALFLCNNCGHVWMDRGHRRVKFNKENDNPVKSRLM